MIFYFIYFQYIHLVKRDFIVAYLISCDIHNIFQYKKLAMV